MDLLADGNGQLVLADQDLDAAAVRLMREHRCKSALGSDGWPMKFRIGAYLITFRLSR